MNNYRRKKEAVDLWRSIRAANAVLAKFSYIEEVRLCNVVYRQIEKDLFDLAVVQFPDDEEL